MSFCSYPEQFFWLHGDAPIEIGWIHRLYLNGNLICEDLIQALFSVISYIRVTVKPERCNTWKCHCTTESVSEWSVSLYCCYLRYCWISSSTVSRAWGGGTLGMTNWCSNGLGCSLWKDAWHISMGWPCWMAFTSRTQKLRPSRILSSW